MLPFEYKVVVSGEGNYLNSINSLFVCTLEENQFEIIKKVLNKSDAQFYKCPKEAGFTVFSSVKEFSVRIFDLDLDGSADGIAETLTVSADKIFILKNHPNSCFKISKKIDITLYQLKDESDLACFNVAPYTEKLSEIINPIHLSSENVQKYSDQFYETSRLTLNDFLAFNPKFEGYENWQRAGPSDYRSFKFSNNHPKLTEFMKSKEFMTWLSAITGLPLLHPSVPIYTRCLQAAGDYQILHGNYSEPFGLDVISSFYPVSDRFEWPEGTCGRIHYLNDSGDEIFQVNPLNNSLTIVYRTEGCTRFTENIKGIPNYPLFQNIAIFSVASE